MNTQPEALRLANELLTDRALECFDWAHDAGYELRRLHKENRELRRVLYDVEPYDGCVAIVNVTMTGDIEWLSKPPPDDTPLYTAPPKREWVGLTDADKQEACIHMQKAKGGFWEFADYLDAKLKEKNT